MRLSVLLQVVYLPLTLAAAIEAEPPSSTGTGEVILATGIASYAAQETLPLDIAPSTPAHSNGVEIFPRADCFEFRGAPNGACVSASSHVVHCQAEC